MTSPHQLPSPTELARRLLSREYAHPDDVSPAALQRVCTRVTHNLRSIVGDDGCTALLARALSRVQFVHPAVKDLRRLSGDDIYLDAVAASVDRHGLPAVAAGVEALLTALVEILSSLIGADMVMNLLSGEGQPRSVTDNSSST